MWNRSTKQRRAADRRREGERALAFAAGFHHVITLADAVSAGVSLALLPQYGDWEVAPGAQRMVRRLSP